jgi:sugar lactone lactonase YvrE
MFVNTGGRVLGFDFDAAGNLIAADAMRGVLMIAPDRTIHMLVDTVDGDPVRYPNSVVVASDGKVYFTDSSARFAPSVWGGTFEASMLDIVEQSATGRVIEYDPAYRKARIVVKGLSFANGIALSHDERTLFVNETGRYRVWKITATADDLDVTQDSAQASVLFDNLPGYPDNLMRGMDGRIWLGFAKPRNAIIDFIGDKPLLRKMVLRFPRILWPMPETYGHVMAFTEDGKVVADLQDPAGTYPETTGITETSDRLYVQSLHAKSLGWLSKEVIETVETVQWK